MKIPQQTQRGQSPEGQTRPQRGQSPKRPDKTQRGQRPEGQTRPSEVRAQRGQTDETRSEAKGPGRTPKVRGCLPDSPRGESGRQRRTRYPFNHSLANTTRQNVESQAAGVTFQLPRGEGRRATDRTQREAPQTRRPEALTCEVTSSAERETARAPTRRLVKPTQPTFFTQFSSEDREDGRRTRAPTQRLALRWYETRQQEHRIVHSFAGARERVARPA